MKIDKLLLNEEELKAINGGVNFLGQEYDANALIGFWNTYKNNAMMLNMAKSTLKSMKAEIYAQFEKDGVPMPADMDTFLKKL